jgi:hypothetical protein
LDSQAKDPSSLAWALLHPGVYGALRNVEETPKGESTFGPGIRGAAGGTAVGMAGSLGGSLLGGAVGGGAGWLASLVSRGRISPEVAIPIGSLIGAIPGSFAGGLGALHSVYGPKKD